MSSWKWQVAGPHHGICSGDCDGKSEKLNHLWFTSEHHLLPPQSAGIALLQMDVFLHSIWLHLPRQTPHWLHPAHLDDKIPIKEEKEFSSACWCQKRTVSGRWDRIKKTKQNKKRSSMHVRKQRKTRSTNYLTVFIYYPTNWRCHSELYLYLFLGRMFSQLLAPLVKISMRPNPNPNPRKHMVQEKT